MDKELYTSSEAREKLGGMAPSSFYRLVEDGVITKITPPNRKQGMYRRKDVDALAAQLAATGRFEPRSSNQEAHTPIEVDWKQVTDIPGLLALDMESFREETIGSIPLYYAWTKRNPRTTLLAFDTADRSKVLAQVTLLPLREETILEVLRGERADKDIQPEEIQTFDEGGEFTLLAENAITRPGHPEYLLPIMRRFVDFWVQEWPRLTIRKIYAEAVSASGHYLVQKLFFGPLYDVADDAYVLDLRKPNPSRFVRGFQDAIKAKEIELLQARNGESISSLHA